MAEGIWKPHKTQLYFDILETQWPIIYCIEYNIGFLGLEKLHPFDAGKWGRVYAFLKEAGMVRDDTTVQPLEATAEDLMVVHPRSYLDSLKWSLTVAGITEVPPVAMLPNFVVQRKVLRPFRFQTGGTILAGKLAMERGWAINIGGGFHHCSAERGGGFCAYADITLSIRYLLDRLPRVKTAMIIDLDAHQGNGHERDFMGDGRVYILDMYNRGIYPHDGFAKRGIRRRVELQHFTEDAEYLALVRKHVEGALNEFHPDVVIYNAGTDVLDGDPLGCLSISAQGIIERDQIVFQKTITRGIPILMVTSGGYQRSTARIIANSILNLHQMGLITCDEAENAPLPRPDVAEEVSIPRSSSDGGLWARFKRSANCITMTRSQTSEQLAQGTETSDVPYQPTATPTLQEEMLFDPATEPTPPSSTQPSQLPGQSLKTDSQCGTVNMKSSTSETAVKLQEDQSAVRDEIEEDGMDMLTFMNQMTSAHGSTNQDTKPSVVT